jgi:hypothetical protein
MQVLRDVSNGVQNIYNAVEATTRKISVAAETLGKKIAAAAQHAFDATIPLSNRCQVQGQMSALKKQVSSLIHGADRFVQKKVNCAARCVRRSMREVSTEVRKTGHNVCKNVHHVVSQCLDTIIPSRKEARVLRGRVSILNKKLNESYKKASANAKSAEFHKKRAGKAEAEKQKAEKLAQQYGKAAQEQKERADRAEGGKQKAEKLVQKYAQDAAAIRKSLLNMQRDIFS